MLRFQVLEMSYWQILATRLKRGMTLDQGMRRRSKAGSARPVND
jgi:hypothetical protein